MRELHFTLSTPLEYAHAGQVTESNMILCKAPTSKQRKECAFLKQAFFRTINQNRTSEVDPERVAEARKKLREAKADATDVEEEELMNGDEVMMLVAASTQVKYDEFLEVAKKLLQSDVAMVGGEERLTSKLIDDMSMEDFERLVGEYLAFFTLQSSLVTMSKA